jgi:hypothetical protein
LVTRAIGNSVQRDPETNLARAEQLNIPSKPAGIRPKRLIRHLSFNCLTLIVIFTLCLYGLGLVGLYMRWFILDASPAAIPSPIVITVVLPAEPNTEQVIVTVVVTPTPDGVVTATLEPTPTQSWPSPTPVPAAEGSFAIPTVSDIAPAAALPTPPPLPPFYDPQLLPPAP